MTVTFFVMLLGAASFVGASIYLAYMDVLRVKEARNLVKKGAVLVDVDPPTEYAASHHRGAINIPFAQLSRRAHELDPQKPIVVCGNGDFFAARGAKKLRALGFGEVLSIGRRRLGVVPGTP